MTPKKISILLAALTIFVWQGLPLIGHTIGSIRYGRATKVELELVAYSEISAALEAARTGTPVHAYPFSNDDTKWFEQSKAIARIAKEISDGDRISVADAFDRGLLSEPKLEFINVERENVWNGPILHVQLNHWDGSCMNALRNEASVKCNSGSDSYSYGAGGDSLAIRFGQSQGHWHIIDLTPENYWDDGERRLRREHEILWFSCFRYEMKSKMILGEQITSCDAIDRP